METNFTELLFHMQMLHWFDVRLHWPVNLSTDGIPLWINVQHFQLSLRCTAHRKALSPATHRAAQMLWINKCPCCKPVEGPRLLRCKYIYKTYLYSTQKNNLLLSLIQSWTECAVSSFLVYCINMWIFCHSHFFLSNLTFVVYFNQLPF